MMSGLHRNGPEEEEWRRLLIAADIHDDSVQTMLAADLKLELLKQSAGPEASELVSETQELVREAARRLRRLMFELSPVEPGLSLAQALERYLKEVMDGFLWSVSDRTSGELPPETVSIAYRIAQEALTNVRRHSFATSVHVDLGEENGGLLIEISDNGCGFVSGSPDPGHLGLEAMRLRAEQSEGWLVVDSSPGKGTNVTFWLAGLPHAGPALRRAFPPASKPARHFEPSMDARGNRWRTDPQPQQDSGHKAPSRRTSAPARTR